MLRLRVVDLLAAVRGRGRAVPVRTARWAAARSAETAPGSVPVTVAIWSMLSSS
ncbi:hypothetical protein OG285_06075 [Streptomyces sp. NBC_01471]|uniref:hypothetical protein n=1 Tax=Streptomyces sp. NBC_01471 TaxID=2903879 RepID=UPI0032508938